jgi:trans-aconitate 2-methyltransferase
MWDAALYQRFGGERARPFFDLLARVGAELPGYVVDMGCGPGHLTAVLAERWPLAEVCGVDNSPQMIEAARQHAPAGAVRSRASAGSAGSPWRAMHRDCRSCSTILGTGSRRACPT